MEHGLKIDNVNAKISGKLERKNRISLNFRNEVRAMAFIAPSLILLLVFKYYPIISGMFISFFEIDIVNLPGKFVGFDNYVRAFGDARFYSSMWNNMKMFVYAMLMTFWCPIILAVLVNEVRRKARTVFRMLYFIPAVAPGIAMTILWKYFWQPDYGLANYLIGLLGIQPQMWLNSKELVYFCMNFPGMLICGGMGLVIYLAALQDVPNEQYESAMIDGAGFIRRIWSITLPNIAGIVKMMILMSVMGMFNAMEGILVWTGGGPGGVTETILLYAYKQATNSLDYSYAVTMATIVFFVTLVLTAVINRYKGQEGA